jgi:lysophospholipid acyltransferase (LPLAT)-like uncharacterized protein
MNLSMSLRENDRQIEHRLRIASFTVSSLLAIMRRSCRYYLDGVSIITRLFLEKRHVILTFWHRNLVEILSFFLKIPVFTHGWLDLKTDVAREIPSFSYAGRIKVREDEMAMLPAFLSIPFSQVSAVMVSASRDGEIVSRLLEQFGFSVVRGSSGSHGLRAALGVIQYFRNRTGLPACVIMIADGSRGPACKLQRGIPFVARLAKSLIIPCSSASSPSLTVPSWDRMTVPMPFSRVGIVFGDPIEVITDNYDKLAYQTEFAINACCEKALRIVKG